MGNYKESNNNISIIKTTAVFVVLGLIFLIIGFFDGIAKWVKTCGIAFLIISVPFIIWIIYKVLMKKIKDM